jgi:hypothetical protein
VQPAEAMDENSLFAVAQFFDGRFGVIVTQDGIDGV